MVDTKKFVKEAEEKMESAILYLDEQLARIRAGKANPKILDGIRVPYYGSMAPLSNVASINTPDAKTIVITPWEKNLIKEIEKAILNSEVGITPENNGEIIDAIEALKKSIKTDGVPEDVEKDAEAEVQKVHDKFIKKVDELYIAKEKEIMTV